MQQLDLAWELQDRNLDSCRIVAAQVKERAQALQLPFAASDALNQLGSCYEATGNLDTAAGYYRQAFAIDSTTGHLHGQARALYHLSIINKNQGQFDSAITKGLQAIALWGRLPERKKQMGSACIAVGNIHLRKSNYDTALVYFFRAADTANAIADLGLEVDALTSISLVYQRQKLFKQALTNYNRILTLQLRRNKPRDIASCYTNIGGVYLELDQDTTAIRYLMAAVKIYEEMGQENFLANAQSNIAIGYEKEGNFSEADKWARLSLAFREKTDDRYGLIISYNNLGNLLLRQEQPQAAVIYLKKADSICKLLDLPLLKLEVLHSLSAIYAATGDYDNAYHTKQDGDEFRDTLEIRSQRGMQLAVAYKEEQTQRILLEKERDKQAAEIERKNIVLVALSVVMLLVAAVFWAVWRANREKLRAQHAKQQELLNKARVEELIRGQEVITVQTMLQTQEEERKRIAQDLHDSLGIKLSTAKLYYNTIEERLSKLPEDERQEFQKGNSMLDEACDEVRRVAANMHSGELVAFGLAKALASLCQKIESVNPFRIDFQVNGLDKRLEGITEFNIYQVVQELLANVMRHAKATEVTVQLQRYNGSLNVLVEDNGVGFDPAVQHPNAGIGMKSIQERVKFLRGTITIDSQSGHGTTISIDIPLV